MAPIVRQASQSRLESQPPQVESTTLRLKLSTPKPLADQGGAWSFLQALSLPPPSSGERKDIYVHPREVPKWSLSYKSLEMCTEMLCSENGCDDMVSSLSSVFGSEAEQKRKPRQIIKICRDFPPTLTTIRGGEALRIRARRRDGRLVMEAVKVTSSLTCSRSVRSHGRLRLYLSENNLRQCDIIRIDQPQQQCDNDVVCLLSSSEDLDGNSEKVGGEMGNREFSRPTSSCKQSEIEYKGLLNWEPFWVATS